MLEGQKVARIMTITALLDNPNQAGEMARLNRVLNLVDDARGIISALARLQPKASGESTDGSNAIQDAAKPLLSLLEARCRAKMGDHEGTPDHIC